MIVSLEPSYLETLSAGEHTLTAEFDDGENVNARFTVLEAEQDPDDKVPDSGQDSDSDNNQDNSQHGEPQESGNKPASVVNTGDENGLLLWTFVLLGSLGTLLISVIARRRSKKDQ